jgi:ABC-type transport system involved in multi-copper enzyme maturation permease subunit
MSAVRTIRDLVRGRPGESAALLGLVGGAACLVAAAALGWLPLGYQVLLWVLVLAGFIAVGRLVGPVLFYDLVRSARRLRFVVIRTLYALFVAFVLVWMFWIIAIEQGWQMEYRRMAEFATWFFYVFLMIQFFAVVLLTPAYTAGAIAEEKERKTIQFILATDLENREIVLGKVTSRLLNLTLLLLAGVPILSFLQFLGGIDFILVLAGFAATGLTMFSLAGLSILNSVMCRRARDAIVLTYFMAIAYYVLACGAWGTLTALTATGVWPRLASFPSFGGWTSPVTVQDLVDGLNAGNVIHAVVKLGPAAGANAVLEQELPGVLGRYAIFHALAGTAALVWAMLRLRTLALREDVRPVSRKKRAVIRGSRRRPRVGQHAMIWKEVYAEGGLRLNALGRIVAGVLFLASFLPVIIIVWVYFDGGFRGWNNRGPWEQATEAINQAQMRFVGTVVACLLLLAVVVRAAGSIRSEHERSTFDELLTTRLTNREILFAKWLGAILSVRWGWAWLGAIWFISMALGGVQFWALPLVLVAWVTYAAVGAGVGLWFSVSSRTTLRATVAALVTVLFMAGGHWLVTGMFCYFPLAAFNIREKSFEWMLDLQFGQTPPLVMGLFAYHGREFREGGLKELIQLTVASLFGVGCWAALVPLLWYLVRRRFEEVTGRHADLRPERVTSRRRPPRAPKRALVIDADPPANGQGGAQDVLTVLPVDPVTPEAREPSGGRSEPSE